MREMKKEKAKLKRTFQTKRMELKGEEKTNLVLLIFHKFSIFLWFILFFIIFNEKLKRNYEIGAIYQYLKDQISNT